MFRKLTGNGACVLDIEKWLALCVLLECGGVYVALDVLWLGQHLPLCEGRYREMWVAPRDYESLRVASGCAWATMTFSMAHVGSEAGCAGLPQALECYFL